MFISLRFCLKKVIQIKTDNDDEWEEGDNDYNSLLNFNNFVRKKAAYNMIPDIVSVLIRRFSFNSKSFKEKITNKLLSSGNSMDPESKINGNALYNFICTDQ